MNEKNLIPINERTKNEQREITSKGGKASGKARRRKKSMKQVMDMLLEMPANTPDDLKLLEDIGVDVDDLNAEDIKNILIVNAALLKSAKSGDVAAIRELRSIIRDDYKIKIEESRLKLEQQKTKPPTYEAKAYGGIPARLIAPAFSSALFDISEHNHSEYIFPGGRGSTKSSFVSLCIIDLIMRNEDIHACILRQVADTLRSSVYQQILWAISVLELENEFECRVSPLEITRKTTGQKIFFRGADDPAKIKSIKAPFGYIGLIWFEELDQFAGEESVRKIEQSVIRGGDKTYKFKSFNPPKSAQSWANKYIKIPREDRLVSESTYLTVPQNWLGKGFMDDAEFLRETNPTAYENEYLGVANGMGGNVFDNVQLRKITDDEIKSFDNVLNGVDWGWYPDLYAFVRVQYSASQHTLYIWQEYTCNKTKNIDTAERLTQLGITANDLITCDSSEKKSVEDYRAYGLLARNAEKGPNSRAYSYKWLQSLRAIVIDNERCPIAAKEFLDKEYDRDKEGNVIGGYPDGNDHTIDAVRYATERIWRRRGQ